MLSSVSSSSHFYQTSKPQYNTTMYSYDNPFSSWNKSGTGQSSVPSLYGALPYPTPSPPSSLITFYITSFNPTVLNCTVIGPDQQHVCYIVTDPQMPGYTIFRSAAGKSIALVEWQSHPQVEVRGVFSKRKVKDWLNLSPDKRYVSEYPVASQYRRISCHVLSSFRFMEVAGMRYSWVPQDKSINVSSALHT